MKYRRHVGGRDVTRLGDVFDTTNKTVRGIVGSRRHFSEMELAGIFL